MSLAATICPSCQKNPRPFGRQKCDPCVEAAKVARVAKYNELKRQQRASAGPRMEPCRCGCGVMVAYPYRYTVECGETAKGARARAKAKESKNARLSCPKVAKEDIAPPPLVTDEEQTAINEESLRREAARVDRIYREMGLTSAKGRQLASEPRSLAPEEITAIAHTIKPPRHYRDTLAPYAVGCQAGR